MLNRLFHMPDSQLTKKVFNWDLHVSESSDFMTWSKEVKSVLEDCNLAFLFDSKTPFSNNSIIEDISSRMMSSQCAELENACSLKPKLRTFITFKKFTEKPTSYVTKPLSFIQRKFMAKLRLGSLQLRIETDRFNKPKLEVEKGSVKHVLLVTTNLLKMRHTSCCIVRPTKT